MKKFLYVAQQHSKTLAEKMIAVFTLWAISKQAMVTSLFRDEHVTQYSGAAYWCVFNSFGHQRSTAQGNTIYQVYIYTKDQFIVGLALHMRFVDNKKNIKKPTVITWYGAKRLHVKGKTHP